MASVSAFGAAIAGVFLTLAAWMASRPVSTGFPVSIARRGACTGIDRSVVVRVQRATLLVNTTTVGLPSLRSHLLREFETRAFRMVFVEADSDVLFADVANVVEVAHSSIGRVGLLLATADHRNGCPMLEPEAVWSARR